MTVGERMGLVALSVSSAALIREGLLMKSPLRSVDTDGQMSWAKLQSKNEFSATAWCQIQTALVWNQTANSSALIEAPAGVAACWEAILINAVLFYCCFKSKKKI